MKFTILESKADVIKRWVDTGLVSDKALKQIYSKFSEEHYGAMDWIVHAVFWLYLRFSEGDVYIDESPRNETNFGWDYNFMKTLPSKPKFKKLDNITAEGVTFAVQNAIGLVKKYFSLRPYLKPEQRDMFKLSLMDVNKIMETTVIPPSKKVKEEDAKKQANKIFENDEVLVVEPLSHAASCLYGKGTRWCTTSEEGAWAAQFESYNSMGRFFYIIDKTKQKDNKYAIFVADETGEMEAYDAQDKSVSPEDVIKKYKLQDYIKPRNNFVVIEKISQKNPEQVLNSSMKFTILENTYTFTKYKNKQYVFYINPTSNELSAANETKYNRGIIDENGDLYVEARILDEDERRVLGELDDRDPKYSDMMHSDMIEILRKLDPTLFQGVLDYNGPGYDHWGMNKRFLSKMICLNRIAGTNKFELSEIYNIYVPPDSPLIIKAKKKNPTLKFKM